MGGWDSDDQKVHTLFYSNYHCLVLLWLFSDFLLFLYFSYWNSGEPNGSKGENCVDIKNFNAENSWNDERCSTSLFWICEKKVPL